MLPLDDNSATARRMSKRNLMIALKCNEYGLIFVVKLFKVSNLSKFWLFNSRNLFALPTVKGLRKKWVTIILSTKPNFLIHTIFIKLTIFSEFFFQLHFRFDFNILGSWVENLRFQPGKTSQMDFGSLEEKFVQFEVFERKFQRNRLKWTRKLSLPWKNGGTLDFCGRESVVWRRIPSIAPWYNQLDSNMLVLGLNHTGPSNTQKRSKDIKKSFPWSSLCPFIFHCFQMPDECCSFFCQQNRTSFFCLDQRILIGINCVQIEKKKREMTLAKHNRP